MSRDETEAREVFAERYAVQRAEVNRRVERAVIGGDWGANGYTTMAQADELAALTRLDGSMRLLDLGAGRGWPGLYLAKATGCSVVLADLPLEGLRTAVRRAHDESLQDRVGAVAASASHLPLRRQVADAVVSCDVFC